MGGAASIETNTRVSVVSDAYQNIQKSILNKNPKEFRNAVRECPDEVILNLMNKLDELRVKAEKNLRRMASIPMDSMDLPESLRKFSPICVDDRIIQCVLLADRLLYENDIDHEKQEAKIRVKMVKEATGGVMMAF